MSEYNILIRNKDGFTQIDDVLPSPRVIEIGTISSGTSVNFAREAGALYLSPSNRANGLYMNPGRTNIYCQNSGSIEYLVLGDARTAKKGGGYGIYIKNGNEETTFIDSMKFGILKYSSKLPANISSTPITYKWEKEYPDAKPYVSALSLGLDRWQIGLSYITYHNLLCKFLLDGTGVQISTFVTQSGSGSWGTANTFTVNFNNFLQIIQV